MNERLNKLTADCIGWATGEKGIMENRGTIVLLHGSGGSRESWTRQISQLDEAVNVLVPEFPGHGESAGPCKASIREMAEWVGRILSSLNLPGPVCLGGHSLGGAVAVELALTSPEMIDGLVLIGTGARLAVNPALFDGLRADFRRTVELVVKWCFDKSADPELINAGKKSMLDASPEVLISDFKACDDFDRRSDVESIKLPTLIICGDNDKMTTPELAAFLNERIKGSKLVLIERAGHMVFLEKAEAVNRAITEFMDQLV